MQYATKAARMGAFLIDGITVGFLVLLCCYISVGLGAIALIVGETLYFGFMEGSKVHGTFGKYLMGIVTVDENGQPLDYGKSFIRAICRLLSGLIFFTGFLIGLFDEEGKTLHDRIAGTRVITKMSMGQRQPVFASNSFEKQPKLIGVTGEYAGRTYLIRAQGTVMGRDPNTCDFVFAANVTGISRQHCKIEFNRQTGMFIVSDLGSSYGTFLAGGVRVPQGQPAVLQAGGQFYLAERDCMFMVNL